MKWTMMIAMAAVMVVSAGTASAQCADPDNLLTSDQCGFDTPASVGPGNWEVVPYSGIPFDPTWGAVAHSDTGGMVTPGSMVGAPDYNGDPPFGWGWTNAARICLNMPVTPGQVFGFGAHVFATNGTIEWCNVMATTTSTDTCDGGLDYANFQSFTIPSDTWYKVNEADATLTITQPADYIELRIACGGPAEYTVYYDNMYLGDETLVPVELMEISVE